MRDSQYKSCTAQNQFTAYLLAAIRNYKRTYLKKHADTMLLDSPSNDILRHLSYQVRRISFPDCL